MEAPIWAWDFAIGFMILLLCMECKTMISRKINQWLAKKKNAYLRLRFWVLVILDNHPITMKTAHDIYNQWFDEPRDSRKKAPAYGPTPQRPSLRKITALLEDLCEEGEIQLCEGVDKGCSADCLKHYKTV